MQPEICSICNEAPVVVVVVVDNYQEDTILCERAPVGSSDRTAGAAHEEFDKCVGGVQAECCLPRVNNDHIYYTLPLKTEWTDALNVLQQHEAP